MEQRGRKSAAKLAVVTKLPNSRPKPPASLTPRQAEHWKRIAATMTAEWFTAPTQPMLADLCRWIVRGEDAERHLQALDLLELPLADHCKIRASLLAESKDAARTVMAYETKMRLTQQAQRDSSVAKTAAKRGAAADKKPWE